MPSLISSHHGEINGKRARLFTLRNDLGMGVQVSELGAHLISVKLSNADGEKSEMTLGHENFEGWANNSSAYLGATVGRFGNRIAHGRFSLEGKNYQLATNNQPGGIPCHLHGGPGGFHTKIWKGEAVEEKTRQGVRLHLFSPDGEEGYPGNLHVKVTYWLENGSNTI